MDQWRQTMATKSFQGWKASSSIPMMQSSAEPGSGKVIIICTLNEDPDAYGAWGGGGYEPYKGSEDYIALIPY